MKFTSRESVALYFSGEKIECLLCHKFFRAIGGSHLRHKHNMTVLEYKNKFGLPLCHSLQGNSTRNKQSANMIDRIKRNDPTIQKLTPEILHRAHHSPKKSGRRPQRFFIDQLTQNAQKATAKKRAMSDKKNALIDWDDFLKRVKGGGGRYEFDIPTDWDLAKKIKDDKVFCKKYKTIRDSLMLKNILRDKIINLTDAGYTQTGIARKLSLSKTHVARIQRLTQGE